MAAEKSMILAAELESPPEYDDVLLLTPEPEKVTSRVRTLNSLSRVGLLCSLVAFSLLALTTFWLYGRMTYPAHLVDSQNILQSKMSFRGPDGVDVEQHLSSSVTQNYVIYHVVKADERAWIVDDFAAGIQLMKVEADDESVCYVTSLNRSMSTQPAAYSPNSNLKLKEQQARVQTIFMKSEMSISDLESLGSRAVDLCAGTPVYWVTPVTLSPGQHSNVFDVEVRSKRNVAKCTESCCYVVCCCRQKKMAWQSADSFNCNHICEGCTPRANTFIRQVC